jgi:hypothetical protein
MWDAFISYSRSDLAAIQGLERKVEERGLCVFVDRDRLRPGEDWPPKLGAAIKDSRMVVLCWSANAAGSDWVKAEIKHSLLMGRQVLPWLLDNTPLPPMLQQKHGVQGTDPAPIVNVIADERRRFHRRRAAALLGGAVVLAPAFWWSRRFFTQQSMAFRGHVVDQQGNAVPGATIEADGIRADTNTSGEFKLVLPGPPSTRALRVHVSKAGYRSRIIETQSDVPDLGVVLEKDQ